MCLELLHDVSELFEVDSAVTALVEQPKTEFILLLLVAVVVNIHYRRKLWERYVPVTIGVSQSENTVGQEWVRRLTKEAEILAELGQVH